MIKELDLIEQFRDLSMVCELNPDSVFLGMLKVNNDFLGEIRENKKLDLKLVDLISTMVLDENNDFKVDDSGVLIFRNMICVLDNNNLRKMILEDSLE